MKKILKASLTALICLIFTISLGAKEKNDHKVTGHIKCKNESIPFATILIKGTTIGTSSDDKGNFKLQGLPIGTFTIRAQAVGFKAIEKTITIKSGENINLNLELTEDAIGLEQVVITADRNEKNRKEASVIVNTLTSKSLTSIQNNSLSDGLNFCPGLRMENNCQNCGFTQVRMNGMEGAYSQILVNSRPIFSGLAGVYGLELIPSNMVERVEIVRGGGSALYGSNAIAGTINIITKDPTNNSYEVGFGNSITGVGISGDGRIANDYSTNFNTSLISENGKSGLSLFGAYRNKDSYDANNDTFSEISKAKNTTLGARFFHRFNYKSRLTADFFNINEDRRGGDAFNLPMHEAMVAEGVRHDILTGALNYDYFIGADDIITIYASGQKVNRDSYYGANQDLSAYGNTKDFTYSSGVQFKGNFNLASLVTGIELNGSKLRDKKLGYLDITDMTHKPTNLIADQMINTIGAFFQYDFQILPKLKTSVGIRFDRYEISDKESKAKDVSGNVLSPRLNLLYNITNTLQTRISYSQGYRAPQIFDEDLHVETSGSRKVIHKNSPSLKQETSNSYTLSLDYTKKIGEVQTQFLVEAFQTKLKNPFVNEIGSPNDKGEVIYTRINGKDNAKIKGINLEANVAISNDLIIKSGFTLQTSKYGAPQDANFNEIKFYRTPNNYGFISIDTKLCKNLYFSSTANYTGKMLIPYYGEETKRNIYKTGEDAEEGGVLISSKNFFDLGGKLRYNIKMKESKVQIYAGIKNILNSYQNDFDTGKDRDPGYIYGPGTPRTVYLGIKIGNLLN